MAIEPKINQTRSFGLKRCEKCGVTTSLDDFSRTHSIFYPDHILPVCNDCINKEILARDGDWEYIDKLCQWAGIPFVVKEWQRICDLNQGQPSWGVYTQIFAQKDYESIGWSYYFKQYQELLKANLLEEEIPGLNEQKWRKLRDTWGSNYDEEALRYLDDLYNGLCKSQNINGALQVDQAKKICKLSYEIDSRIRAGDKDVDKFMGSYDKLVKAAEFTPKNTKNAADFDSVAELSLWLEKRGWLLKYYDNVTRDIIDELLKNVENYNQRLYTNEGGIGEEITERIRMLKIANDNEKGLYDIDPNFNPDEYDNDGFVVEDEEFNPEGD